MLTRLVKKIQGRLRYNHMCKHRNSFKLLDINDKAVSQRVNLNYWAVKPNLGDALSPVVVDYLLQQKGLTREVEVAKTTHLYAIGSLLTSGVQDCVVWGSGILNPRNCQILEGRVLDVRATRGPITRIILQDCGYDAPTVYGDPAVFLPEIYRPSARVKQAKYGFIIHWEGSSYFGDLDKITSLDSKIIDIKTCDYKQFVDEVVSVECVVSSSLHGIIIAEAYGIPAILIKPEMDFLKYYDWYYATKRFDFPMITSFEELASCNAPALPDTETMRNSLRKVFPYDIFC